jgi:hypothetical protein
MKEQDRAQAVDASAAGATAEVRRSTRKRRRVTQPAPEGSDPHPFDPPSEPRSAGENDDRLKADRPPHWQ